MVKWLTQQGFRLLSIPGKATYLGHSRNRYTSVLDLTFANGLATQSGCLSDWAINQEITYGSDHYAIQWILFNNTEPIDNTYGLKFNIKDMDREKWVEAFNTALKDNYYDINIIINPKANITIEALEQATTAIMLVFEQANKKAAKIRRPSPKAKPWWNKDLSKTATLIHLYRDSKHTQIKETGLFNIQIEAEIRRVQNLFKQQVYQAKHIWANQILEDISSKDIWSIWKWTIDNHNYPMPVLTCGPDIPSVISYQEKCDTLRDILYQEPPNLPDLIVADLTQRNPDEILFIEITPTEVNEALFSTSSNMAPGPSQITYKMIK